MNHDLSVKHNAKINLKKIDPASTHGVPERDEADRHTARDVARLGELQDLLYANRTRSVLVILQGMDAAGKDGTIRKVFDAINPIGVSVESFKTPTALEARHDFLWRCHEKVPPRGEIGVFNRSYYEDVLVVRVHADKFLPPDLRDRKNLWTTRFEMINNFEQFLTESGTAVLKFFLHISKEEQRQRFMARQQDPTKNWKLADGDFSEREYWKDYRHAYEQMLGPTSTKHAPWHIIPADHHWVRDYHVARTSSRRRWKTSAA